MVKPKGRLAHFWGRFVCALLERHVDDPSWESTSEFQGVTWRSVQCPRCRDIYLTILEA